MNEQLSFHHTIAAIKDVLSKESFVLGIFLSKTTIEEEHKIDLFILIENNNYIDETVNLLTSINAPFPMNPDIWSLEALQTADQDHVHHIFKEGKLIYWNAIVDVLASQVFKVRPYTIFTFEIKGFSQHDKVRFNYQLYGKRDNGLLNQWLGHRLANSCFYVPYCNKYKVLRYFNKNNIKSSQKDVYF